MDVILIKAGQLILALSILVVLHEGGHFFFAKLFGTRVTRFYLFANFKFHLFSSYDNWFRRLLGKKPMTERDNNGVHFGQQIANAFYRLTGQKDKVRTENVGNKKYDDSVGTEYGIGWLPIGGYCQIEGMIDETQDKEKLAAPAQPWEFRSKPAWQRLLIMIGGVLVNFVLAIFIYSMILFAWGEEYLPMTNIERGFKFSEMALNLGFRNGDVPLEADGVPFEKYSVDVVRKISEARNVKVLRDGKTVMIDIPEKLNLLDMLQSQPPFMAFLTDAVVESVVPGSPASKIGLAKGDTIVAVNNKAVASQNDFINELVVLSDKAMECSAADSMKLRNVSLVIARKSGLHDTVSAVLTPDFKLGYMGVVPDYKTATVEYGFLASFPAGAAYGWNVLSGYVSDMKYVFTKKGAKSVGGFATIGSIFPSEWNWQRFWELTAFLSIILAFMNILPIPALDGGHVLFLLYEMIFRRKPSESFLQVAQMVGMGLLLLLMVWANFNDIVRFLF